MYKILTVMIKKTYLNTLKKKSKINLHLSQSLIYSSQWVQETLKVKA